MTDAAHGRGSRVMRDNRFQGSDWATQELIRLGLNTSQPMNDGHRTAALIRQLHALDHEAKNG